MNILYFMQIIKVPSTVPPANSKGSDEHTHFHSLTSQTLFLRSNSPEALRIYMAKSQDPVQSARIKGLVVSQMLQ